jgi:hypothetical protein
MSCKIKNEMNPATVLFKRDKNAFLSLLNKTVAGLHFIIWGV